MPPQSRNLVLLVTVVAAVVDATTTTMDGRKKDLGSRKAKPYHLDSPGSYLTPSDRSTPPTRENQNQTRPEYLSNQNLQSYILDSPGLYPAASSGQSTPPRPENQNQSLRATHLTPSRKPSNFTQSEAALDAGNQHSRPTLLTSSWQPPTFPKSKVAYDSAEYWDTENKEQLCRRCRKHHRPLPSYCPAHDTCFAGFSHTRCLLLPRPAYLNHKLADTSSSPMAHPRSLVAAPGSPAASPRELFSLPDMPPPSPRSPAVSPHKPIRRRPVAANRLHPLPALPPPEPVAPLRIRSRLPSAAPLSPVASLQPRSLRATPSTPPAPAPLVRVPSPPPPGPPAPLQQVHRASYRCAYCNAGFRSEIKRDRHEENHCKVHSVCHGNWRLHLEREQHRVCPVAGCGVDCGTEVAFLVHFGARHEWLWNRGAELE